MALRGIGQNPGMTIARRLPRLFALTLLTTLLVACGGPDSHKLQQSLYHYAGAIRWGEIDTALTFVDPQWLEEHPFTALERQRFAQVQVSGYHVKSRVEPVENEVHQVVEIRMVNRHTLEERAVIDRQIWRWDDEEKRWWLTTGLPDISRG